MWIAITAAAATLGGLLCRKFKVPAGLLLGAALFAAILNLSTGKAYIWPEVRILSQIIAGTYLGNMISKRDARLLRSVLGPYMLIIISFLILNLIVGYTIYAVTDFSLMTCLLSSMPGGISDSPLVAMDMGADVSVVTVLQFIRVIFGLAVLPALICQTDRIMEPKTGHSVEERAGSPIQGAAPQNAAFLPFLPTLIVGASAGVLGYVSGVKVGALSFSLMAVGALNFLGKGKPMPEWLRTAAQILCGCCIGVTVEEAQIRQLPGLFVPALILCLGYFALCIGMGLVVSRRFGFRLREAMLFLAPAGAVEMTLIAHDLGIESPTLGLLQMLRLVTVVLLFPQIFNLIAYFL